MALRDRKAALVEIGKGQQAGRSRIIWHEDESGRDRSHGSKKYELFYIYPLSPET